MPKPIRPTIDESVTTYLRTLAGAIKSARTITAYRTDLEQFARFLRETNCAVSSLADVSQTDVMVYRIHLAGQGTSGTTRGRKLAALREFECFRKAASSVAANPTLEVAMPKKERVARGCWLWTLADQDREESARPGSPEVQTL